MPEVVDPTRLLEWAVAEMPLEGETESGDRALVVGRPDGVLMAVVDGLGHGHDASTAAALAVSTMSQRCDGPLEEILTTCHEALKGTRGAALTLAVLTAADSCLRWFGVGNVEAVVIRHDGGPTEHALVFGGVVGFQVPRYRVSATPLRSGDLVIMATDGLHARFSDQVVRGTGVAQLAPTLLRDHATRKDDACILVARYAPKAL